MNETMKEWIFVIFGWIVLTLGSYLLLTMEI